MIVVMALTAVPFGALDAVGFTQMAVAAGGVEARLNSLRSKYPNRYFWNHKVTAYSNNADELMRNGNESFADSVTTSPCATHNSVASVGQYDCNYFDGGVQCYGFAGKVFYDVFGQRKSQLTRIYDNKYGVQVGDYVRVNNDRHSAVVLSKSGNSITVVECNLDGSGPAYNCMIRWDATYSIDSITYYCHATNYDSVNNSGEIIPTYFTSVSSSNITDDAATITATINLTNISSTGFYLGTTPVSMVKSYTEIVNKNTNKIWYDIKNECGITLRHATTYYYKFYIVVNSKEYQSETKSFTTTGTHNSSKVAVTKATFSADGKIVKSCSVCGKQMSVTSIPRAVSTVLSSSRYTYNAKAITPSVTVKDRTGKVLVKGTDYNVTYAAGRTNPGRYAVTVTFINNYSGSITRYFDILPGVTGKIAASQTTNAVKLTWYKVPGATGYRVFLYNTKTKKYVAVATTTKNTVTLTKLQPGTDYTYAVKAYSTVGGKVYWSAGYKTIATATKPNTPTLKAVAGSKRATLSWTKQKGADGYVIYMATSKNGKYTKIANVKGTVSSFTKTGLTKGRTYYFKAAAYSVAGGKVIYSGWSAVRYAKIK